jgi:hypothetical protein
LFGGVRRPVTSAAGRVAVGQAGGFVEACLCHRAFGYCFDHGVPRVSRRADLFAQIPVHGTEWNQAC